jgi:hypothetical protein
LLILRMVFLHQQVPANQGRRTGCLGSRGWVVALLFYADDRVDILAY